MISVISALILMSGCYTFHDVSIQPANAKTVRVSYLENKARYINPVLSPQLTERLRQKINNQTKLTQVQGEDADFDISGWISDYTVSTAGVSGQNSNLNRLTVSVHIIFRNRLDPKRNQEADVSRNFDFPATSSFEQAQASLLPNILQQVSDEIFNRIFSNW